MKVKSILIAAVLALALTPAIASANVRPVVESFTFTPNDFDLISANTNVVFELVVSHPSGVRNTNTQVTLTGPYGSTLATNLIRTDSPVNLALTKVTFKGTLNVSQAVLAGAYSVSIAEIENNSSAGYIYGTGVITPSKLRDLIGAEYALLVRSSGDLNLIYNTFMGPTHDTTLGISYDNPATYNNANPPIWKVGETYEPSKYFEVRVPTLPLVVSVTTPVVCSTNGKELKLISAGSCVFKVSTAKTKDYAAKESTQVVTVTAGRTKPGLTMSAITNQTSKNLPKTIEIFRVYSPTGVYVLPQATTPTVCIAAGFYVQIVGGGTCTLTYQSEANTSYLASDLYKVSFEVTRDPQTITFTPPTTVDIAGKTLALTAAASSGGAITYSTTSVESCSVAGATLNLLMAGNCVITATQSGSSTFAPVSTTATIMLTGTVVKPVVPVVSKKTIVCVKGKTTKKVSGINPKCPKGYKVKK
jgi:ribosomal protein S11